MVGPGSYPIEHTTPTLSAYSSSYFPPSEIGSRWPRLVVALVALYRYNLLIELKNCSLMIND